MKIVLVRPPYTFEKVESFFPPLGLLSIGSVLYRKGHQVNIIDLQKSTYEKNLPLDDLFYHEAAKMILDYKPDIVGFTSMSVSYALTIELSKEVKSKNPNIITIFGGPQATLTASRSLELTDSIDIIVRGEAEETISELIDAIERKEDYSSISGISYRNEKRVIENSDRQLIADLDKLPLIDYELLQEPDFYKYNGVFPLEAGRGCPFNCTFCSTSLFWRRVYRMKSPNVIMEQMKYLKEKFNVKTFSLQHDNFTANRKELINFCNTLIDNNVDLNWVCSSRVDHVDSEILELMSRAGCKGIFFGVETGSPRMQKLIRKNLDLERIKEVIDKSVSLGMDITLSFIIGFPDEKVEDLNKTLKLVIYGRAVGVANVQIHVLKPEPNTDLTIHENRHLFLDLDKLANSEKLILGMRGIDLIEEDRNVFSNFYNFKPKYLPLNIIYGLSSSFVTLIYLYPKSVWMILKILGLSPVAFFTEWENYSRNGGNLLRKDYNEISDSFLSYFNELLQHKISKKYMELLVGYIEYEKTLTNFKGGLEKNHNSNEINDRQKELIYLTFPTHIFSSNFNIKKINESIRKGKSIEELIQYNETVWIALIGRDKSTRSFIGISILKAFVLEKLIHGPKSKEELISLSFLKWPNINKKGLEEKVSEVLDSLADEGIILVS